jgi:hypothetical protein
MHEHYFPSPRVAALEDAEAWVFLSGFDLRKITAVDSEHLGEFHLRPAILGTEGTDATPKADTDVSGHP